MTYTFKLSRRMAMSRSFGMLVMLSLALACTNDLQENSDPSTTDLPSAGIVVSPKYVVDEPGQTIQLNARLASRPTGWDNRRDFTRLSVEWETSGGMISESGAFVADAPGSYKVVGKGKGRGRTKPDTSVVIVVPPPPDLIGVTVTPDSTQVTEGQTRTFVAKGVLSDSTQADVAVTWTAEGGTIDAGGVYQAGSVGGRFRAVARSVTGALTDTVVVVIDTLPSSTPPDTTAPPDTTVPPPAPVLRAVLLSPASVTLEAGATKQFTARGRLSNDSTVDLAATYTATGGSITGAGLYTAGARAGSYRVIATAEGLADTAAVSIASAPSGPCSPTATYLCPGDDVAAKVAAQPQGTSFTFAPGVFRGQSITPKSNMSFTGSPGSTILTGARVLSDWTASGSSWYAGGQSQENTSYNPKYQCQAPYPGCFRPEQLWVDGVLYEHVLSQGEMGPGKWYFDYGADRIYIPVNPDGKTVETSVTRIAFGGSATGVTIRNLIVEKYANEAQKGVVNHGIAAGWVIEDNEVRWNHGTGIVAGTNGVLRRNKVHHQGQMGLKAFGSNALVEDNEIAYNNTAGFGPGLSGEAGGTKFVGTSGLVVRGNFSHHNDGPGLWTDINNYNCLYENNRVEDNKWRGIFHEISYDCVIRNNQVRRNGHDFPGTIGAFEGSGILISNSPNVEVYGNVVEDNRNGIMARDEDRGGGTRGPWNTTNLYVHDNVVRQTDGGRAAGITDGDALFDPYSAASNNRYARNTYIIGSTTKWRWAGNRDVTLSQWLSVQDSGSTVR